MAQVVSDEDDVLASGTDTYLMEAGSIKTNGYIVIQGRPCRVVKINTSRTGKYGEPRRYFTARDVFTNEKYEDRARATRLRIIPMVSQREYILVDISHDDFVSLMDESGTIRDDLQLPFFRTDLTQSIREKFACGKEIVVTVLKAGSLEQIITADEADAEQTP